MEGFSVVVVEREKRVGGLKVEMERQERKGEMLEFGV